MLYGLPSHNLKVVGSNPTPATNNFNDLDTKSRRERKAVSASGPLFLAQFSEQKSARMPGSGRRLAVALQPEGAESGLTALRFCETLSRPKP